MPNFRGIETDPGWIKREFARLRKEIRESNAAKKLQAATIGKGGLTIKDGGRVTGYYPSGRVAFEFGSISSQGAGLVGDSTYGFRIVKDADSDGVTTNALAEIFQSASIGRVIRFFNVDYFTATGDLGAIISGGGSQVVATASGLALSGASGGVQIDHITTGGAANCFISSVDNRISRSTSSRRYKRDIQDTEIDPAAVLKMQGRTWRDKREVSKDAATETRYVGFIAEELHDLGLFAFVVYDPEGKPEAIAYDRLSVALLAVLKDQQGRIEALESANKAPAKP